MKFSDEGVDLPDEILIGCIRDVKLSMMTTNPYDNSSYIRMDDSKNFVVQRQRLQSTVVDMTQVYHEPTVQLSNILTKYPTSIHCF